jgi:transposase InsO family protein
MHLRHLTDSSHKDDHPSDSEWHAPAFEAFESVINPMNSSDDIISLMTIETDDELHRSDIISLLNEYRDIFSETLNSEPALVPPLELTVDQSMWEQPKHHTPPRPQTPANQVEIKRQLDLLLRQNIIRPSEAGYYSQVHLAEKPPKGSGQKRFCIDYVLLNNCTSISDQWPLPNIHQMLRRLGQHKPKYFAVFDLTAGYHQAPMSFAAIGFTAFICFCGLYEYLRVPFGLKGAPSYFQRVMANVVLAGLVYVICEVYIDDIIVHANTAAEFLQNVRRVFDRMRKHKLLLHPKKARIGLQTVEYTGHVLDRTGLSFSPQKIRTLLDFPIPQRKQQLKQFLGLANYFRDHIKNHSSHVAPLQRHLLSYTKRDAHKPLTLDDEAIAAFHKVKEMIEHCPKLFFLDDVSPIVLYTDASTYGMGGHLVQRVKQDDGKIVERTIALMSQSFSVSQLKWDIPQKESYAIYAAIQKFDYLLRDRRFIIKTDHRNITFMNTSTLSSIRKWKIFISEFDYLLEFIEGEKNIVADAMSRLCANLTPDPDNLESIILASIPDTIRIPTKAFHSIASVHNTLVGHHGVERTTAKLLRWCENKSIKPWPQLRQHVKQFVKICPCCQKMALLKTPIVAHPFTVSSYWPMERLQMDFIGPFPDGKYILNIICCFSRWTELFLCEQANADNAARRLLEHIGRYGAPTQILSDRGSHFVNEVISELLRLVGTEHCLSIAYSKEESAIVERTNREVNRHLRNMFFHSRVITDYAKNIPLVQRIINASPNSRTTMAPSQLLFGNAIDLDRGIFLSKKEQPDSSQPLSKSMANLLQVQAELLKIAKTNIQEVDDAHYASAPASRTEFPVGSYVLLEYPDNPPSRLHAKKRGPYQIVKFHKNDYTLRDLVSHKELTVNITRLTPFVYDSLHTDPRQVAMAEQEEFDVDCILAHRGNLKLKSTLEFKVRWLGYDDSYDSWEPWSLLRNTDQLHAYLKLKGLNSLIPKQFRT